MPECSLASIPHWRTCSRPRPGEALPLFAQAQPEIANRRAGSCVQVSSSLLPGHGFLGSENQIAGRAAPKQLLSSKGRANPTIVSSGFWAFSDQDHSWRGRGRIRSHRDCVESRLISEKEWKRKSLKGLEARVRIGCNAEAGGVQRSEAGGRIRGTTARLGAVSATVIASNLPFLCRRALQPSEVCWRRKSAS